MELETKFSSSFTSELRKAQASRGADRSAASNALGHQKTPQFIAAVVRRTARTLTQGGGSSVGVVSSAPRGGTTDVGLHTGGRARDTCWPIVQAAIAHNLCCGPGLFRKTMVAIKLQTLQVAVHEAESVFCRDSIDLGAGCASVDDMFFMLQVIVQDTVELVDGGYEVSVLEDQCAAVRSTLNGFVDALNQSTAAQFVLPEGATLLQLNKLRCGTEVVSPKRTKDTRNRESNQQRHERAWTSLEGCCFLDGASCTMSRLLRWRESSEIPAAYKSILVLRTVEAFMFERALLLNDEVTDNVCSLERVQTLVTQYQQVITRWRQRPRMTSVLDVEQRSRKMLVMWVAFCLAHRRCVSEVPLCAEYNIALNWEDLKVAVLSGRAAIAALQHVATYIRTWNKNTEGPPLFHLTNQEPTFDFGQRFGLNNTDMVNAYDRGVAIWDAHVQSKWRLIEQKKREAAELRAEIARQNQRLLAKQSSLEAEEERLRKEWSLYNTSRWYHPNKATKRELEREIEQIRSIIRRKESTLSRTLDVPPYLVRPLPSTKTDAIQVIFMLTMPRNLEILGSLCLTAQRALAPAVATSEMNTLPSLSSTTWQGFYTKYAPSQAFQGISKVFTATPAPFSCPRTWGPQTVDDLYSLTQYSSECVWDPTLHGTALTWIDAFGSKLDLFRATLLSVIDSFIETMPQSLQKFQWMNSWPGEVVRKSQLMSSWFGGGNTRGNLVYANLHDRPDDFEKISFISLGSLRAFPNQQYRKLQWALLGDVLPWSDPCVEMVVRQSLYQVGVLTDEATPQLLWKFDMHGHEGLETFCAALRSIASKLEETPRNFEFVPLLSELAGFALQYSDDARGIVKMFAGMARRWAEDARSEYKEESSPLRIGRIRRKECVLYGFALLAYSLGPWDDDAAQDVCELIVLFRTSFLCASINLKSTEQMLRTESNISEFMSRRMAELIGYVTRCGTDAVLTGLVRLVSATAPRRLRWMPFRELPTDGGKFGSCFEAFDESMDVHYSINLFTGLVLTDGYAPGGLPADIRNHKRFQSLFGRCNFEVFSANGILRTERKYCDRLYDFALEEDGDLFVQELSTNASGVITRTIQLCSTSWTKALRKLFPAQLGELYSHWYWVEGNCVLFRPQEAKHREAFFVATFTAGSSLTCYKVPFSDTKRPYEALLSRVGDYDRFVGTKGTLVDVLKVLTKFESEKFLHPLKSAQGVTKIELPRFKLTFSLNDKARFESEEHMGYVLATNQQFDDFLPRFSQYLVLKLKDKSDTSRPAFRVLLPVGSVDESSEGMVAISTPSEAGKFVDVACYDVHRRLKTFETETISARLQLAAVLTLLREAGRLAFLFGQTQALDTAMGSTDEKTEYADMCAKRVQRNPLRSQFRSNEEKTVLGHVKHFSVARPSEEVVTCDPPPVPDDYVKTIETDLKLFLQIESRSATEIPPLPLDSSTENAMGKAMLDELQVNWDSYHSQAQAQLKTTPALLLDSFMKMLTGVSSRRAEMETYVMGVITTATSSTRDRLLALANFVPLLTVSDVVRCAFDDETLHTLAPKLSERSRDQFKAAILQFMELCVLEDKVERLVWKAKRRAELSDSQLIEELMNVREWESSEFPYWLAFEVEGRLQIRHEQFVIARHLIESPGTSLPPSRSGAFPEPPTQRSAAVHAPLLVGIQQPFHRQIELNTRRLEFIRDILDELRIYGGIQIVAPEHRMSLELKRLELGDKNPTVKTLDAILDSDQFVDVLDECDALLHHKYHLVYAVGTPIPLCSRVERWMAAEALLRVLVDKSPKSRVRKVLQAPHVSCSSPDYLSRFGAYEGTRLNTVVESTEPLRDELKRALVLDLIDNAPFEFMWLKTFGDAGARDSLVQAITDSTSSLEGALGDRMQKLAPYITQLLALRGLVAFGVFEHCLEKRYRVNFGLPSPGTRPKKIAIPFRAADVPSERSEFSHPDVCIVLTLLGYYHGGLTDDEVRSAFRMLLRLDISEQEQQYNRWYSGVQSRLNAEERKALCDVRHVSLADARQFETLCRVYKFCMEMINFYFNTCVFPKDTQQYPQRLSRTAWNLAAGDNNIGFSGTNDNHRLLPLSVTQREPNEHSLLGTNGKMIDKILQVTHSYDVVRSGPQRSTLPWQSVLLFAMDKKAQALIDTGALLAGVTNNDAAEFLLRQTDFSFAGVTYYDSREELNCWMIADKADDFKCL
ncbi:hypothetical protein PF008_g18790 [Phytophthora fragariae]|uniref:ubiquitinyl hydrolase 1 n=1 Tax=Phytophthora fragariae TaxID=53985 RepID=A0A6G0R4A3_9STRA|nr:hypothetical protein PF008_g18790 [Phytophthora fragariae]